MSNEPARRRMTRLPSVHPMLRGAIALACLSVATISWLRAITEAGSAVQGAPHARAFAAALAAIGAGALWGAVWAAAARNPFGRWQPRNGAPSRAPRRLVAARIALVYAALVTALMILALPQRDRTREELVALAALAFVAVASILGAVFVTRRPRAGRALVVTLGIYAVAMAVWRLPSMLPVVGPDAGSGTVALLLLVGGVWAAHIFAAACVLSLRGAWPEVQAVGGRR